MIRCLTLLALLTGGLAGCGEQRPIAPQQSCIVESADADAVLAAAVTILRREFGHARVDAAGYAITCDPVEFTTTHDSGTARDLLHGRSTMRRTARFTLGRRGNVTIARLQVDLERQETARAATNQPATGRLSDTPAYTPIDRDAATTYRQNAVWVFVRRDRRLERQLLDELREQFAPAAGELRGGDVAPKQPAENAAGSSP